MPSGGRHAEDFYVRKTQRLRPGLNPQTWVPEASMLTTRPPKPSSCNVNFCLLNSMYSFFSELTRLWRKLPKNRGPIPRRAKDFSLLSVHIGSGGHDFRAALSVETKRPEHIPDPSPPIDGRLGMRGYLPPLLRVPSRCSAQLVKIRQHFWPVSKSERLNTQFQ